MSDQEPEPNYAGTIVYCSREDHAPPPFAGCLARLAQRHPDAFILHIISNDIADARNQATLQAKGDWIWHIDTDMLFAPTTLKRLLAHNVDVVQVLCLHRHPPHEPVMWSGSATDCDTMPEGPPRLVETHLVGAGGTLYRKRAFEAVPGPWFEGVLGKEDVNFARKLALVGIKMYVDMTTPVRHLTPMAIYPKYINGVWYVCYEAMNGQQTLVPYEQSRLITPQRELARA